MPDVFHEDRFPTGIAYRSSGGPEFLTEIATMFSGHEKRNRHWLRPRERWEVLNFKSDEDFEEVRDFFYTKEGRLIGFRFKNHKDYQATESLVGTGDGAETDFQLAKVYTFGASTYSRKIYKPHDTGELNSVQMIVNGLAVLATLYDVDYTTGIVSFDTAPANGHTVAATFEFDIPVRFDNDFMPIELADFQAQSGTVALIEIKRP